MKTLSRRHRILASLVLAAGAFASIASSPVSWEIADSAPVPGRILDVAQPSVGFLVRADLVGTVQQPIGYIDVQLRVTFPPEQSGPATLSVSIGRLGDPDNLETVQTTIDPTNSDFYLSTSAFVDCETAPCTDEFTVWIDRADLEGPPITPVMIAGDIRITVSQDGNGNEPPAGTAVTLTVTELEDQN